MNIILFNFTESKELLSTEILGVLLPNNIEKIKECFDYAKTLIDKNPGNNCFSSQFDAGLTICVNIVKSFDKFAHFYGEKIFIPCENF